jgi:hypothetical protein
MRTKQDIRGMRTCLKNLNYVLHYVLQWVVSESVFIRVHPWL